MRAVFIDVFNTLVKGSTAVMAVKYYFRRRAFGLGMVFWSLLYSILHYFNVVNHRRVIERGLKPFVGRLRSDSRPEIREVFEQYIKKSFYMEALALIEEHRQIGDKIVLLTTTSFDIAEVIAEHLGIEYIATVAVIEDGRYTDRFVEPIPYEEGKLECAGIYCRENGFELETAYFYTDSHADLPLLEKVGNPRVVNPDIRLARVAKKRGWKILRFERTKG